MLQPSIVATQPDGEISVLYRIGLALVVNGASAEWRFRGVRLGRARFFRA